MPELELIPHPDAERTYAELRSEFRADNLHRVRSLYAGHHPVGWAMIGDPTTARDKYMADDWAYEMLCRLDGHVAQDFGLRNVPFAMAVRVERLAQESLHHSAATWDDGAGVTDHDAPACAPVESMSDDDLAGYCDRSIKESERG